MKKERQVTQRKIPSPTEFRRARGTRCGDLGGKPASSHFCPRLDVRNRLVRSPPVCRALPIKRDANTPLCLIELPAGPDIYVPPNSKKSTAAASQPLFPLSVDAGSTHTSVALLLPIREFGSLKRLQLWP